MKYLNFPTTRILALEVEMAVEVEMEMEMKMGMNMQMDVKCAPPKENHQIRKKMSKT